MPNDFPFLHVGHGTSKVSDHYALWLLLKNAPDETARRWTEAALPEALRDAAREDGTLGWAGPLLHVRSGMDFRYVVQQYDPQHLDWLNVERESLDQAAIDRIIAEVMDSDRGGPRDPKKSAWAAFDLDVELSLAQVHARHGIRLVVKDVQAKAAEQSKWHDWSATRAPLLFAELRDLLSGLEPGSDLAGFVHPLLRLCFRVVKPKSLSVEQRDLCVELLRLEGWSAEPDVLAQIVSSVSTKERKPLVERLLRERHPGVLGLFLEAKTKKLLLDDSVFGLAEREAPNLALPITPWHDVLFRDLGQTTLAFDSHELSDPDGMQRKRVGAMQAKGPETLEWARRMFVLSTANGALEREAQCEADTQYYRSLLRDHRALADLLAAAM